MRTFALVAFALVGCSAPSVPPPSSAAPGPIVGHVQFRDRTIDLTVETVEAHGADVDLDHATAQQLSAGLDLGDPTSGGAN